jgi:DNA topoisomerase I
VIERLRRRRSRHPELLAFRNGTGNWTDVRSEDVNAYLKEKAGREFSAKDFRTWHATVLAAFALASMDVPPASKTARKRAINDAVKGVAAFLGNTPAVCRRSYIDPRVFDRFRDGATIERALRRVRRTEDIYDPRVQRSLERAVIRLIED